MRLPRTRSARKAGSKSDSPDVALCLALKTDRISIVVLCSSMKTGQNFNRCFVFNAENGQNFKRCFDDDSDRKLNHFMQMCPCRPMSSFFV